MDGTGKLLSGFIEASKGQFDVEVFGYPNDRAMSYEELADYIFGNNVAVASSTAQGSEKIAMTAPVTLQPLSPATGAAAPAASQKIAMTAPVGLQPLPSADPAGANPLRLQGAQRWRVHFVMPAGYTLATLPKPKNPAVRLREVPATTWAVLRYSGVNTEAVVQQRTEELMAWLAARNTSDRKLRSTASRRSKSSCDDQRPKSSQDSMGANRNTGAYFAKGASARNAATGKRANEAHKTTPRRPTGALPATISASGPPKDSPSRK